MAGHGTGKRRNNAPVDLVAALQHRYDPPVAARVGQSHQLFRHPFVVVFDHADVSKVHAILFVGIKTGTDKNNIRIEIPQQWQNLFAVRVSHVQTLHAGNRVAGGQSQTTIQNLAAIRLGVLAHSCPRLGQQEIRQIGRFHRRWIPNRIRNVGFSARRIKPSPRGRVGKFQSPWSISVSRGKKDIVDVRLVQPWPIPLRCQFPDGKGRSDPGFFDRGHQLANDFFRSVPVVDIEIHNGDFLDPLVSVHTSGVRGSNGNIVQKTKAVRASIGIVVALDDPPWSSVVPRRPNDAKSIAVVSRDDLVDGLADAAGGTECCLKGPTRHGRVGIQICHRGRMIRNGRTHLANGFHVAVFVAFQDIHQGGSAAFVFPPASSKFPRSQDARFLVDQHVQSTNILRRWLFLRTTTNRWTRPMQGTQLVRDQQSVVVRIHNQIAGWRDYPRRRRSTQCLQQIVWDGHSTLVGVLSRCKAPSVGKIGIRALVEQQPNNVPVPSQTGNVQRGLSDGILGVDFNVGSLYQEFRDRFRGWILWYFRLCPSIGLLSGKGGYAMHGAHQRSVRVVYVSDACRAGSCGHRLGYCVEFCGAVQSSTLRSIGLGIQRR
mmetsp:Transcript_2590/g.5447  ORF Transcript_2590/g.5447 Transcript_2590/m.5447 type:complete len:600 (+) Transcript_2590:419-2218(+)